MHCLFINLRWGSLWLGGLILSAASCAPRAPSGDAAQADRALTIKGSDTMVYLVSAWAEAYMRQHPDVEISVTGGGSGTGFAALLNRTTGMCAASRDMMPQEQELAASRGIQPRSHVVARDGIAVIVHPSNPVSSLSLEQLAKIFAGAYDNWQQVGGPDQKLIVLSRDSSSGTYLYFQEHVLGGRNFRRDARHLPATSAIVQSVADDVGAIGYVGLGYAREAGSSVKALAIRVSEDEPAMAPSVDSVRSQQYALVRPLRLFTSGEPEGLAALFLEFCVSDEGQAILSQSGYVAVR